MADCVITGTITSDVAPSGPSASTYIGSPVTYYSSASLTVDYEEISRGSMTLVSTDGVQTISLGSMSTVKAVYVGADKQVDVVLDGNTYTIGDGTGGSTDGGFVLLQGCDIATLTVTAKLTVTTTVTYAIFGE